jgi:hypothetical protein
MPAIPAFGRLMQEDHKFRDSLAYILALSQKSKQKAKAKLNKNLRPNKLIK